MALQLRKKGYTEQARIDFLGVHGYEGTLEFEYRPVAGDEADEITAKIQKADLKGNGLKYRADAAATRIVQWNVEVEEEEVKPSAAVILELIPPQFIYRLFNIILGDSVTDAEKNS